MSNRPNTPAPQPKWCSYCRVDSHNDAECWCTRPAGWDGGIVLNADQWDHFIRAMKNPAPPSPSLIAGAKLMAELSKGQNAAPQGHAPTSERGSEADASDCYAPAAAAPQCRDATAHRLTLCDGKYTFYRHPDNGTLLCDRYGEPWREFIGDKAVAALFDAAMQVTHSADASPQAAAVLEKIEQAHKHICDIAKGDERFRMSIPARPDRDTDLIVCGALNEARRFIESATRSPDGYAVVMPDGGFVGIWRDRESAEKVLNRSPSAKGERIVPMVFAAEPPSTSGNRL